MLVREPLTKFKKAREMLTQHENTNYHKFSVKKANDFLNIQMSEKSVSISVQLDKQKAEIIEANRQRLVPIIKTILFCAHNKLPLRAHRDDGNIDIKDSSNQNTAESNDGIFRNLLTFRIDSGDLNLKNHILTAPKNCTMISKTIQNEIIFCIGKVITTGIVNAIKQSKFFTIICDETTDISTKEQMTFCVRYLDSTYDIKEVFLGFIELHSTTGQCIKEAIKNQIKQLGLSIDNLRGQGYDGGSNMAGRFNGVQALIRQEQPLAMYLHCLSHCLNLAISKSCEVSEIRNMMGILGRVCSFFSCSAKRVLVFQQAVDDLEITETKKKKLKPLCATRWVERHNSVITFKELYEAICNALASLEQDNDTETSSKAMAFNAAIRRSDFVIALEVASFLMSYTVNLSKYLQSVEIDLSTAFSYINDITSKLENIRQNEELQFKPIFLEAHHALQRIGTTITMPRLCNKQTNRSNIKANNEEEYYRRVIFIPFLDHIIIQMKDRFNQLSTVIPIEGIIPIHLKKYTDAKIVEAARIYENDMSGSMLELQAELAIWRHKWSDTVSVDLPKSSTETLKSMSKECFPNIEILLKIFATIPVTSATGERSFSSLKLLKSYLRSTMGQERLNGLALAYINKSRELNINDIVKTFCQMKSRRIETCNWST